MGIIIALLLSLLMVVGFTIGCKPADIILNNGGI